MVEAILRSAGATHVGLKRTLNEDCFLMRPEAGLWAVADGMGGHGGGDVASRMAIAALERFSPDGDAATQLAALEAEVAASHREMRAYALANNCALIGTTLVAVLVCGAHFACVWCGDSRGYLLRDRVLRQLTRDHSETQALVDRGVLDAEEARVWPRRSVLTRALGAPQEAELDFVSERLAPGDMLLLCSDGLTTHCADAEIAAALAGADPQAACDGLIALTLGRGASDNVTVVALRCEGVL
jgi:protein phosphatase